MTYSLVLFYIALGIAACAAQPNPAEHKMSDDLRLMIEGIGEEAQLSVFIRIAALEHRGAVESTGITVERWAGDVAVARGTGRQIERAAQLEGVQHISLSQNVDMMPTSTPPEP